MASDFPADCLRLLPCWEAYVDIAPTRVHGRGPFGVRNVVPITGGRFKGQLAPETAVPQPFERGGFCPVVFRSSARTSRWAERA